MIIVTSYENPDLDGIACSIAYSELLDKLGKETKAVYFGDLGLEVDFVKNYLNKLPIQQKTGPYSPESDFVLVDTADPDAIDPEIPLDKVVEIYDHRELVFTEKFVNSKKQIEIVGSCATLIAEKFEENKITPSDISATYLYSAIVSNTINFKNSVTTSRDIKMANRLKSLLNLPEDYIEKMFTSKSNVTPDNFEVVVKQDFAIKEINDKKVGIAQIEVAHLEELLKNVGDGLQTLLLKLKDGEKLDYILFTGIDIFEGKNIFKFSDEESKNLFSQILVNYGNIIMRKQIWPKLNNLLSKK